MKDQFHSQENIGAKTMKKHKVSGEVSYLENWYVTHKDKNGNIKDQFPFSNLITDEGLDYSLGVTLNGVTQISSWYIGLTDGSPTTDPTDTMSSHSGWTEITDYDESTRQEWVSGAVSSQTIDNSGSPAVFTFNADGVTVGGAFLVSDNTKDGTSGTLYAVGAFNKGDKVFDIGDTVEITATFQTSYVA